MSEFEKHLREVAEQSPGLNVRAAIMFAEARANGDDAPLPDPNSPAALALWAQGFAEVMSNLPHKPINAIKELRGLGHKWGMSVGLYEAKCAVDVLRAEMRA